MRLTVPTCFGCGAMNRGPSCESGCREQKLVLVRAAAHDSLATLESRARESIQLLRPVAEELSEEPSGHRGSGEPAHRYAQVRERARVALRAHRAANRNGTELGSPGGTKSAADGVRESAADGVREPSEPAVAWFCPDCGALESPQPCLGICLWRPVEWVDRDSYERERLSVLATLEAADRLHSLIRRLALVAPRPGAEEQCLRAFRAEAGLVLGTLPGPRGLE